MPDSVVRGCKGPWPCQEHVLPASELGGVAGGVLLREYTIVLPFTLLAKGLLASVRRQR